MQIKPTPGTAFDNGETTQGFNSFRNDDFFNGFNNQQKQYVDPLVTGYSFIKWTKKPVWVEQEIEGFFDLITRSFDQ